MIHNDTAATDQETTTQNNHDNQSGRNDILKISIFNATVKGIYHSMIFFLGIYMKKIGFSGTEIGIIFMVYSLTGLISILPSGFSNDIFKSKHVALIGLSLLAIQYLGIANFTTFPAILTFFLIGSIGKTINSSSMDSLFFKTAENNEHTNKKISLFLSLNSAFVGTGIILGGYLLNLDIPFGKMFTAIGLSFAIMAIMSQLILPRNATSKLEILRYKKDILRTDVLFFLLIMFLFSLHYGSEETSYGLFLENVLRLDKFQSGLYMGIAIASMSITVIAIRKILKTVDVKNILLFGTLVSGLGLILMTIPNTAVSLIFRIVHETGDAAMFFFLYYGTAKLFDLKRIGGNTGIVSFVIIIGAAASNFMFGPIGAKFGYNMPFLISGAVSILAFFFYLKFSHIIKHR